DRALPWHRHRRPRAGHHRRRARPRPDRRLGARGQRGAGGAGRGGRERLRHPAARRRLGLRDLGGHLRGVPRLRGPPVPPRPARACGAPAHRLVARRVGGAEPAVDPGVLRAPRAGGRGADRRAAGLPGRGLRAAEPRAGVGRAGAGGVPGPGGAVHRLGVGRDRAGHRRHRRVGRPARLRRARRLRRDRGPGGGRRDPGLGRAVGHGRRRLRRGHGVGAGRHRRQRPRPGGRRRGGRGDRRGAQRHRPPGRGRTRPV
ncbi:MAG: hypothetical protein AVDCRST_MAG66-1933, partial [uncultured Pseudonocardia sp.]